MNRVLERLDELKLEVLGQAADVVVRLDRLHGLGAAFDDVRIDGSLSQQFDALELARLFLKHADEFRADDLALLLRIADAGEFIEEAIHRVPHR